MKTAKTDKERAEIVDHYWRTVHVLAARALGSARAHPDGSATIDVLVWIVRLRLTPESGEALKLLARDHIDNKDFLAACRSTATAAPRDFEAAEALLRAAMAKGQHHDTKGFARFYLAELLKSRAEKSDYLKKHPDEIEQYRIDNEFEAEELKRFLERGVNDLSEEAKKLYERTIVQFGDVATHRKATLGEVANGELFDMLHLSVGRRVPDIVGRDAFGKTFKLSDDRGHVVVLTFSGSWCGPCRRMYPQERELVKRLKDRPFALVSVTNDKDKGTLMKAIQDGEITWRCWWDGGMDGPICLQWGINKFPSVFVIDHKGTIRYRDVRGDKLDEAVDTLLKELPATTHPVGADH